MTRWETAIFPLLSLPPFEPERRQRRICTFSLGLDFAHEFVSIEINFLRKFRFAFLFIFAIGWLDPEGLAQSFSLWEFDLKVISLWEYDLKVISLWEFDLKVISFLEYDLRVISFLEYDPRVVSLWEYDCHFLRNRKNDLKVVFSEKRP